MLGLPLGVLLLGVLLLVACIRVRAIHQRTAMVVVLGDVGRSPRMCYHIASLVRHGWTVYVAGYFDAQLPRYLCCLLYTSDPVVAAVIFQQASSRHLCARCGR